MLEPQTGAEAAYLWLAGSHVSPPHIGIRTPPESISLVAKVKCSGKASETH